MNEQPRPAHGPRLLAFVELWHCDSPGMRVRVRPSVWRRLGLVRSEFATLGEQARAGRRGKR